MTLIHVAIAGASGETGGSIVDALLEQSQVFKVSALARQETAGKAGYTALEARGARVVVADLAADPVSLASLLQGVDVVISTLVVAQVAEEKNLAKAAKLAGVQRFVPSFFGPVCPPRGIMDMRALKEDVLDCIKQLYLPYTVIDIGWWYQISLPLLPSGKIDQHITMPVERMNGNGNSPIALTDKRDIGRYVARIIADPRTLNKSVFAYDEVWTQNAVFDLVEEISGETIPRKYISEAEIQSGIEEAQTAISNGSTEYKHHFQRAILQYAYSWGIRGDNSPEHASYLGYLNTKELYPEVQGVRLEDFVKDVVQGTDMRVYRGRH